MQDLADLPLVIAFIVIEVDHRPVFGGQGLHRGVHRPVLPVLEQGGLVQLPHAAVPKGPQVALAGVGRTGQQPALLLPRPGSLPALGQLEEHALADVLRVRAASQIAERQPEHVGPVCLEQLRQFFPLHPVTSLCLKGLSPIRRMRRDDYHMALKIFQAGCVTREKKVCIRAGKRYNKAVQTNLLQESRIEKRELL